MAWPTTPASTATTDADADKISAARADINQTITNVNNIIGMFNIPASPSDNNILRYDSATGKFEVENLPAGSGGSITAVIDDTSPQLGGNLDVNGFSIVSDSNNEDITLAPHGNGRVIIDNSTGSDRLQVSQILPKTGSSLFLHCVADNNDPPSGTAPTVAYGVDNTGTPTKIILSHTLATDVQVTSDDDYTFKTPVVFDDSVQIPSYTVATLPPVGVGKIIFCSDETGGAVLLFSDGTNWRRVTDRAVAS